MDADLEYANKSFVIPEERFNSADTKMIYEKRRIRVAVMGSAKVGKTSIIRRFVQKTFTEGYKETVEDLYRATLRKIELEILDTAGAHCFPAMQDLAIATADAFILVFAWDDNDSFEYVRSLLENIKKTRKSDPFILVAGNKMDRSKKTMSFYQTEMVVQLDWDTKFQECSAKNNENIATLFDEVVTRFIPRRKDRDSVLPTLRKRAKNFLCIHWHDEY